MLAWNYWVAIALWIVALVMFIWKILPLIRIKKGKHLQSSGLASKRPDSAFDDWVVNIAYDQRDKAQRALEIGQNRDNRERQRRDELLSTLRQEYEQKHGLELDTIVPTPKEWIENRLEELQETWRQDEYF